jgi:hypothetical protein
LGGNICLLGVLLDYFPARGLWNPEDVDFFVVISVIKCGLKALCIWFVSIAFWI